MSKKDLESRALKSVLKIEKKLTDINNVLRDLSMKLCYIIKDKKNYYNIFHGNDYLK
jgi:hypothetical protein